MMGRRAEVGQVFHGMVRGHGLSLCLSRSPTLDWSSRWELERFSISSAFWRRWVGQFVVFGLDGHDAPFPHGGQGDARTGHVVVVGGLDPIVKSVAFLPFHGFFGGFPAIIEAQGTGGFGEIDGDLNCLGRRGFLTFAQPVGGLDAQHYFFN